MQTSYAANICGEDRRADEGVTGFMGEGVIYKEARGLNIKGCRGQNITSVGKLLWQLIKSRESLWIKWVHGVYMKTLTHIPPIDSSWYWGKLNSLKGLMQGCMLKIDT